MVYWSYVGIDVFTICLLCWTRHNVSFTSDDICCERTRMDKTSRNRCDLLFQRCILRRSLCKCLTCISNFSHEDDFPGSDFLTGLIVLTVFIQFHHLILWIFISLAGFGMGSFFGASMSWADKYLNVSGKTGSVFITGSWLGLLALPALTGYLFDNVSPFCYIYACFGDAIALTTVTFLAMGMAHYYHKSI